MGTPATVGQVPGDVLWREANGVLQTRCVVCHGCYDAPCQLVMSAAEGVRRGASKVEVYDGSRVMAIEPTRLFIDASNEDEWRTKGFHGVLSSTDPTRSLILRMLDLKRQHPFLTDRKRLSKDFTLGLDRDQECTTSDDFEDYAEEHASWGMPYALPGLSEAEEVSLRRWVVAGAPLPEPVANSDALIHPIEHWEAFLNGSSLKERLVARYVYEHLFLGHLYFEDVDDKVFYRLVRSRTKSGESIVEIPTRRPFDDPGPTFYYRLRRLSETIIAKTHMPYALSERKLTRVKRLLLEPAYEVTEFPSYEPEVASNPFAAFRELPAEARYRFMLEEARYTIMGFIKGPVCRGQVALDVIRDRFWMIFVDPESPLVAAEEGFLADRANTLAMPASDGATASLTSWFKYARAEKKWLKAKSRHVQQRLRKPTDITLASVWDGEGKNANAALTVFRHFDSASVVYGLVGEHPQTSWIVDYPLLERIHYLLVAGFDVFGNIGHQLNTRMYMDFLRMEGEHNFLRLLPPERRKQLVDSWYRDVDKGVKSEVYGKLARFDEATGIAYKTETPEHELFEHLKSHLRHVHSKSYELDPKLPEAVRDSLSKLGYVVGKAASTLSETSFLEVRGGASPLYFSILRDSAHANVAKLFDEEDRRRPTEDRLTVVRGFLGAYPNTFFRVAEVDLAVFVSMVEASLDEAGYDALCTRFCVRRSDPDFWQVSDRMTEASRAQSALEFGLFDFNRLENR